MDPLSPQEKNSVACRITGALLFSIIGAMVFICCVWFLNLNAALWCLPLEVACLFILSFSKHYLKGELHHKYSAPFIQGVKKVAVILCLASACASLGYIIVGAKYTEVFDERSHFVAAIVAFLSGFWNSLLFTDTKRYESLLTTKGF